MSTHEDGAERADAAGVLWAGIVAVSMGESVAESTEADEWGGAVLVVADDRAKAFSLERESDRFERELFFEPLLA